MSHKHNLDMIAMSLSDHCQLSFDRDPCEAVEAIAQLPSSKASKQQHTPAKQALKAESSQAPTYNQRAYENVQILCSNHHELILLLPDTPYVAHHQQSNQPAPLLSNYHQPTA